MRVRMVRFQSQRAVVARERFCRPFQTEQGVSSLVMGLRKVPFEPYRAVEARYRLFVSPQVLQSQPALVERLPTVGLELQSAVKVRQRGFRLLEIQQRMAMMHGVQVGTLWISLGRGYAGS